MRRIMVTRMKASGRKWLPIATGCLWTAAGLIMLKHAGVFTGGTAGLSLSLAHMWHAKFHYLLLLINAPFLLFSYVVMGRKFTLHTIAAIALLFVFSSAYPLIPYPPVPHLFGAIAGGILIGSGVCLLFHHGASLGGSNILALYLHRKYRINPGLTNFLFDCFVLLISLSAYSLTGIVLSAISIAITSVIMAIYKRKRLTPSSGGKSKRFAVKYRRKNKGETYTFQYFKKTNSERRHKDLRSPKAALHNKLSDR